MPGLLGEVGMGRVLLGAFPRVARAGLDELLAERGLEVLHGDGDLAGELDRADGVVLDADGPGTPELVGRILTDHPGLTVVTCSTRAPLMRVYPRHHRGESYESLLEPAALARALRE